jgi:predicted lipase
MCPKCTRLIVTGHSLGAALATLAALDLKANFPQLNIILYNFGSPRVGNTDFASYYQSKIGTSWRITNNRDIVPHYPPQLLTYHHIATEVWERGSQYTICNSSGNHLRLCLPLMSPFPTQ